MIMKAWRSQICNELESQESGCVNLSRLRLYQGLTHLEVRVSSSLYEGQPSIVFRLQLIGQESLLLKEFTLLNLLIQMVVSSKNILTNTLKIMFGKISGHLFSKSS